MNSRRDHPDFFRWQAELYGDRWSDVAMKAIEIISYFPTCDKSVWCQSTLVQLFQVAESLI